MPESFSSSKRRLLLLGVLVAGGALLWSMVQRRDEPQRTALGGNFGVCRGGRALSVFSVDAKRKRQVRRLWGNGKGRFTTKGRYSSATVRGTHWLVQDRCDGTLTRVLRGVVKVQDFRHHKTVNVRAGHTYLATAP